MRCLLACVLLLGPATLVGAQQPRTLTVGSKKFTESYVLGEIAKKVLQEAGWQVSHKQGMGATAIVWEALRGGDIDVYPEYTGTISEEILKRPGLDLPGIRIALQQLGVGVTDDLGFNNTYALVMKRAEAERLGIKTISDLATHPGLRGGPSHEFLERKDGWKPLMQRYGVNLGDVRGIDHALGYAALNAGQIDLMDAYSTDAEISKYDLVVLRDDKSFFPAYKAVYLFSLGMPVGAQSVLNSLKGTFNEDLMIRLNRAAGETKDYAKAASLYFASRGQRNVQVASTSVLTKILVLTGRHLKLVGLSLLLAILVGIPLGILASGPGIRSGLILGTAGVIQTIPSLALLALLIPIPFFGISITTAVTALFLYSLLPIIRNTATGLGTIPQPIRESAAVLGMEPSAQLRKVLLPIALPTILAGIKTSAVINVGTATLAALIGAGGLGEPIISGLSLNDNNTILQGAIPAALLAILVQIAFDLLEKAVVPRGLRAAAPS